MRFGEATANRANRAAGEVALHTARRMRKTAASRAAVDRHISARCLQKAFRCCDLCIADPASAVADSGNAPERYCRSGGFASCLADRTTKAIWRTTYDRPDDAAARIPKLVVKRR